jgi:membrane DNA delivery protein
MGDKIITNTVTVLVSIIGVAIIAVLVSKQANTAGVIGAGGSAFSQILQTAISPVSGGASVGLSQTSLSPYFQLSGGGH